MLPAKRLTARVRLSTAPTVRHLFVAMPAVICAVFGAVFGASLIAVTLHATPAQAEACTGARVTLCACGQSPACLADPDHAPDYAIGFAGTDRYLPLPRLEIARTPATRAQGLMGRAPLEDDQAMLFVYPDEAPRAFWMKNTPSPLDIVFINAAGRIVSVHAGAIPFDETPIPSAAPARYVLELAAGRAAALGLHAGAVLTLEQGGATGWWR